MLSTAAEAGTKLEFGEIAERNLSNAIDTGMGERDWSAIHELARKKAGLA
jgi:3-hydroxyisobutyrate dehydrogenase-like beta-hydroxyacid dehydrogenase